MRTAMVPNHVPQSYQTVRIVPKYVPGTRGSYRYQVVHAVPRVPFLAGFGARQFKIDRMPGGGGRDREDREEMKTPPLWKLLSPVVSPRKVIMGRKRRLGRDAINGVAWQEFRLMILERDGWTCQICRTALFPGRGPRGATVDHVIPRSQGGRTTAENCRALCGRCNGIKSRAEASMSALDKRGALGMHARNEEWHSREW